LNTVTREVKRGDKSIELTAQEFDLLELLMRHPRQVLKRNTISEKVWGYDFGGEYHVIEVYVGYLRSKLEAGGQPRLIHTVRGVGYVLKE
jgi:DNA-binding response OmpR family regulator